MGMLTQKEQHQPCNARGVRRLRSRIDSTFKNTQLNAADLAAQVLGLIEGDGMRIVDAYVIVGETFGAGEDIDIDITRNGTTILSGVLNLSATNVTAAGQKVSLMSLITAASQAAWVQGDAVAVVRSGYTAGGAPTSPRNMVVIEFADGTVS